MMDFINMEPEKMPGAEFVCRCGLEHKVDLQKILIGKGVIGQTAGIVKPFSEGVVYMVSDNNTFTAAGKDVLEMLTASGINVKSFMFETEDRQLNPDEKTLGRLIYECGPDISLMLAVGSGVINDICRTISYRLKVPYMIVGTAPSMDGYASKSSPLVIDSFKLSSYDHYPHAIICDTDILKNAPMVMVQAGFGDIIGKLTSLADWDLSRILKGEHHCDICAGLMKNAVKKCTDNIEGIAARDEKAIRYLTQALVIAGIAMGIYTSTRPASSSEHYFAHYWDVAAIKAGHEHPLHGNSVGVGTVVTCDAYIYMKKYLPENFEYPKTGYVIGLLDKLGSVASPKALGIDKDLFAESVIHCIDNRPKYGIFHLATETGEIKKLSEHLTGKYYG